MLDTDMSYLIKAKGEYSGDIYLASDCFSAFTAITEGKEPNMSCPIKAEPYITLDMARDACKTINSAIIRHGSTCKAFEPVELRTAFYYHHEM